MSKPTTIGWSFEAPLNDFDGKHPSVMVPLKLAEEGVTIAKKASIRAITSLYPNISDSAIQGLWDAANSPIILTPSIGEVNPNKVTRITPVDPEEVAFNGLRLVTKNVGVEDDEENKKPLIYLVPAAIGEEYSVIKSAADTYMRVVNENPGVPNNEATERIASLSTSRDELIKVAVGVATAGRLLKIGIFPNDALKDRMKSEGVEEWGEEINKGLTPEQIKKQRKGVIVDFYKESNRAIKNLRATVWPAISSAVIGVDPRDDAMFHIVRRSNAGSMPSGYRLSFHDEVTTEVPKDVGTRMIHSIYDPRALMRSVPRSK